MIGRYAARPVLRSLTPAPENLGFQGGAMFSNSGPARFAVHRAGGPGQLVGSK